MNLRRRKRRIGDSLLALAALSLFVTAAIYGPLLGHWDHATYETVLAFFLCWVLDRIDHA